MPASPPAASGFRDDINGLRAWAVLAVVLYHFGVPGVDGGYVGVDVFFVISGFLMSGIVVRALQGGRLSIWGFYMARARRILPALMVLCAALLALAWWALLPDEFKLLSSHVVYSLAFLSNVEYWQEAGYFDVASHGKWLLHTWSLSVEWQFYLLLPLVMAGLWRLRPGLGAQRALLVALLAASLILNLLCTAWSPTAAFFLLHTRAWEMLAGAMLVLFPVRLPTRWQAHAEALGLACIVASIALFDHHSPWPGWRALLPVSGAMLVLLARRASVWTGNPVAQWLGERSYSLYLWHWPLVVGLNYLEVAQQPGAIAAGLLFTLLLGHCSYQLVEQASRRWLARLPSLRGCMVLAGGTALVALTALLVWREQGAPQRFDAGVALAARGAHDYNPRRDSCHVAYGSSSPSCLHGGPNLAAVVIGDSHSGALISAVLGAAPDRNAGVLEWSYSGCAFVPGMHQVASELASHGPAYNCAGFIEWAQARLRTLPATVPVILINRYALAAFGPNEDKLPQPAPRVYFASIYPVTTPAFLAEFSRHITDSACALARQRTVYMVRPVPEMGIDVPTALARRVAHGLKPELSIPLAQYRQRNAWVWDAQDAARARCGVRIIDPLPYLCGDGVCHGALQGRALYYDDDHLSEFGDRVIAPAFRAVYPAPQ